MSKTEWTSEQLQAIEARGGSVLVSAAAGSGKTTVLVERVIRMLTGENPVSVENMLIVTFTRAAAQNMKRKISDAIAKTIAEGGDCERLRRQQMMLPYAKISTIDSFCINLVRENFQHLGVSPDFKLIDDSKRSILKAEALNTVLDKLYEEDTPEFRRLCETLSNGYSEDNLSNAILKIFELSQTEPYPDKWLAKLAEFYSEPTDVFDSPWGEALRNAIREVIDYCKELERIFNETAAKDEVVYKAYRPTYESDMEIFNALGEAAENETWDKLREAVNGASFKKIGSPSKKLGFDEGIKETAKCARDSAKEALEKAKSYFVETNEQFREDLVKLSPVINCLIDAVRKFSKEFMQLKLRENSCDFSDSLHYAIQLLDDGDGNPSELARELSAGFEEILVDEYQDINSAQDTLFRLLSRDESNLFMVGDVKQSIYGFRAAEPSLFIDKRDSYTEYNGIDYPAKITLGKNFRSEKGITENINFAFRRIMRKDTGGIEYEGNDELRYSEEHHIEHTDPDVFLRYINAGQAPRAEVEASYIIKFIKENVGKMDIRDGKGGYRKARYSDFCVLFATFKEGANTLVSMLEKENIPAAAERDSDFFNAPEIAFMTSLLRVVDNPYDDVSLLAVMFSPVFGFSPSALAEIRADSRKVPLWKSVMLAAENGNGACSELIEHLQRFHRISTSESVSALVNDLLDDTGYRSVVSAMNCPQERLANLNTLLGFAAAYDAGGREGLSGFLRYFDRAKAGEVKMKAEGCAAQSSNSVRVMTIHKSKGLEAPIVILAETSKSFNTDEITKSNILISRTCGIGIKCTDLEKGIRYETLPYLAVKNEKRRALNEEELRLLYVALTRAQDKLVIIFTRKEARGKKSKTAVERAAENTFSRIPAHVINNADTFGEIVANAFSTHIDAVALRMIKPGYCCNLEDCPSKLDVKKIQWEAAEGNTDEPVSDYLPEETEGWDEYVRDLCGRLEWEYPYSSLEGKLAKRVASDFADENEKFKYFASRKPMCMSKNELTPAQRGTATHKCMQFIEFDNPDVDAQLLELEDRGILSAQEADAVERRKISAFLSSEICRRILSSPKVFREESFTCSLPAREVYEGLSGEAAEEKIIIDGVVDCAFIENGKLVIVDYKTDRNVTEGELAERYKGQLNIYRQCLAEKLGTEVSECLLYSFTLGRTITV